MRNIVILLAGVAALAAGPALAFQSPCQIKHTYYERVAGEGDPVGYWILYCDSTVQQTGQITQYVIEESYDC